MNNNRRLIKEYQDCVSYIEEAKNDAKNECIKSIKQINNSIYHWEVVIVGPMDSPFKDGNFLLDVNFPKEFPFKPPTIVFKSRVYHPNINQTGAICLDILKDAWSPALTVQKVLLSISSLLADPNPNDPLDTDAANLFKNNRTSYNNKVQEYVKKYSYKN
jgi:ubiquitin-conjugating enzyme E2 D